MKTSNLTNKCLSENSVHNCQNFLHNFFFEHFMRNCLLENYMNNCLVYLRILWITVCLTMTNVFCDITPCGSIKNRRFGGDLFSETPVLTRATRCNIPRHSSSLPPWKHPRRQRSSVLHNCLSSWEFYKRLRILRITVNFNFNFDSSILTTISHEGI
jgi:hypothetical protein